MRDNDFVDVTMYLVEVQIILEARADVERVEIQFDKWPLSTVDFSLGATYVEEPVVKIHWSDVLRYATIPFRPDDIINGHYGCPDQFADRLYEVASYDKESV